MATTVTRIGPVGTYQLKKLEVTLLTATRQAAKVGNYVLLAVGVNQTDTQAVRVQPNIDADGNAANGYVAAVNADAGPDTINISCLVSE